jgi:trigger factor
MPEIELGDYTKIKLSDKDKKIADTKIEVKDSEIEKVIEHLQQQKSKMDDVDRPVKKGDWVEVTFKGTIDKVTQERLASQHHPLVIGSGAMIPGFEDEIIGMKVDQEKTFKITFPKDYFAKDLAGKAAEFTVTLHKVKKIILPELNEAFSKDYGHDSMADLKKAISEQLAGEKKVQLVNQVDSLILEEAKKLLKVEIPEGLITQEIHRMIERSQESIEKQGVNFEQYLQSIKKTHDDLHKDYYDQAKANIEVGFLLGEIIKREKLNPQDKQSPTKALDLLKNIALGKPETKTKNEVKPKTKTSSKK